MYCVYVLKSIKFPERLYVGYTTTDLNQRLSMHNEGKAIYTAKYKPWGLVWHAVFVEEAKAIAFEKFLKTGSGKILLSKHML